MLANNNNTKNDKMIIILKRLVLTVMIFFVFANAQAETKKFNMVFVPASERVTKAIIQV